MVSRISELFSPPYSLAMGDYLIPLSSPLDTLARKTSSRRRPIDIQIPSSPAGSSEEDSQYPNPPVLDAPPKRPHGNPPQSPLLHTRFRASVATQSSLNTSADLYGHTHSRTTSGTQDLPYDDDVSIYSTATSSFPIPGRLSDVPSVELERVSDLSVGVQDHVHSTPSLQPGGTLSVTSGRSSEYGIIVPDPIHQQRSRSNDSVPLPTVVVSVDPEEEANDDDQGWCNVLPSPIADYSKAKVGRIPSILPKHMNFSRPVRPADTSEDSKRLVLARNAFRRSALANSSPQTPPQPSQGASPHPSGLSHIQEGRSTPESLLRVSTSVTPTSYLTPSTPPPPKPRATTNNQPIPLSHDPPPVSSSRSSLYSAYSYYQLDSPTDSPTSDSLQVPASPHTPPPRTPSPLATTSAPENDSRQLGLADQLLQEGIQHHEANRLREAAIAFEKSATTPGGSGVGMLMWGLTLRHGWGCPKDEALAFSWLRRAAEVAVGDLERARAGLDIGAVRGELILAIYEVGQCFFQGWGVKKDQKMAVVSHPFGQTCVCSTSAKKACGQCLRGTVCFSLISKLRRGSATLMRSKSWRSATQMAAVARKTAKRPPSGTVQL